MIPGDLVVLDMKGNVVEGHYKPSTDAPTHIYLYKTYKALGGIVHTHSSYATSWAQAGRPIPPFGTTHADHFYGEVPCTRVLEKKETERDYEINTGKLIVEKIGNSNPLDIPAILVNGHGPFCWGTNAESAVQNAITLEEVAKMALFTILLGKTQPIDQYLLDKHFKRKHGDGAYYGQK
jgi:L-ribulose-5-phosphate 4-epimerase